MSRTPDYGIIYNWDGAPHGHHEVPQTMEQFLGSMYAPLADTQVGAHFWCIGEHVARYRSEVQETMGEHVGREYHSVHQYTFSENVLAMLERGEDAQAAAIDRGHELGMHVYASVRMNDNHFNGAAGGGPGDVAARLDNADAAGPSGMGAGRRGAVGLVRAVVEHGRAGGAAAQVRARARSCASAGTGTGWSSTGSVTGTTCTRTTGTSCGTR